MTSYQSKAAPTHYNDALPIHFASALPGSARSSPGSTSSSKSISSHHKRLLHSQANQTPSSGSEQQLVLPPTSLDPNLTPAPPSAHYSADEFDHHDSSQEPNTLESASLLFDKLVALPTTVPEREHSHYSSKLRSILPSLAPEHRIQLIRACSLVLSDRDQRAAHDSLVSFMMITSGVASWATGLRRLVDGCVLSS
ncbi:uncharacterized protein V1516DRAFT_661744 [Lipomyces oligophaga]|uniref:uncharacterized protein n=1 Tax=Lipomyces oligophaga TaxID=45792 RepID=UPI0034CEA06B